MEATPPAVIYGGGARPASAFPELFHIPGYTGLSNSDTAAAKSVSSLRGMNIDGLVPPIGDLLQKAFNRLPGIVFDFLIKKLPSLIVNAIKDIFTKDVHGSIVPGGLARAANGGRITRDGPIMVGERGREVLWGSRGQYVSPNSALGGVNVSINVEGNIYGDRALDAKLRQWEDSLALRLQMGVK